MKYILELDQDDMAVLDAALTQMPYRNVVNTINKINNQIAEQQTKKEVKQK
jgi:hypothetical protein